MHCYSESKSSTRYPIVMAVVEIFTEMKVSFILMKYNFVLT